MGNLKELSIPPEVKNSEQAQELMRVWATKDDGQYMAIDVSSLDDPAAWGLLLYDLMQHIARAYERESNRDFTYTLARIKEGLLVEWENPTDKTGQ